MASRHPRYIWIFFSTRLLNIGNRRMWNFSFFFSSNYIAYMFDQINILVIFTIDGKNLSRIFFLWCFHCICMFQILCNEHTSLLKSEQNLYVQKLNMQSLWSNSLWAFWHIEPREAEVWGSNRWKPLLKRFDLSKRSRCCMLNFVSYICFQAPTSVATCIIYIVSTRKCSTVLYKLSKKLLL